MGLDAKNKNTINQIFICRVCSLILREPFQLECGHRQCGACIEAVEGYIKQILIKIKIFFFPSTRLTIKCAECNEESAKNEVSILNLFHAEHISMFCFF
jgi:hypothetical protein